MEKKIGTAIVRYVAYYHPVIKSEGNILLDDRTNMVRIENVNLNMCIRKEDYDKYDFTNITYDKEYNILFFADKEGKGVCFTRTFVTNECYLDFKKPDAGSKIWLSIDTKSVFGIFHRIERLKNGKDGIFINLDYVYIGLDKFFEDHPDICKIDSISTDADAKELKIKWLDTSDRYREDTYALKLETSKENECIKILRVL